MQRLLFGTAGIPLSTPVPSLLSGLRYLQELGLDGMELEFVRSINVTEEKAPLVKARKGNLVLTCHGQYYINLFSLDPKITEASAQRVIAAAERAYACGAWSVCFHAAYYMKQDPQKVYDAVKARLRQIILHLKDRSIPIWIRPETTGKMSQFGTYDELLRLSEELEQVMPCFDFSHIHARSSAYNTLPEFQRVLGAVEHYLGRQGLDNMHIHVSGIHYADKGERNHLNLVESDFNWQDLLCVLKEFRAKGIIISESPNIEGDALLMKEFFCAL